MKKSTETLFNAIGGLNDELLDRAIGRSIRANGNVREEKDGTAVELRFAAEKSAPRPRSKMLLRIGLIAAALTLVLGIGVIAEQIRKGLAERIIPVDKEATVIVNEDGTRIFKKLVVDENAPVTKEDLIDRALNTADYYDTISVLFERYRGGIPYSTISIDADLNTAKSYQKAVDYDGRVHESISDGETVTDYVNSSDYSYYRVIGTPISRLDEDVTKINSTERISIDEYGKLVPLAREEFTNASYALFCINPAREVFLYLNDGENWEITGETEYLGRKAVSASGTAYLYTNEDPNEPAACQLDFCIDKCTGMLLKLTVSNEDGIIDGVIVKEFAIDQPELTDARIEEAIESHQDKKGFLTEDEYRKIRKEEEETRILTNEEYHQNYVPIVNDPDEILTKETVYNRMFDTTDYFNTASIKYTLRSFEDFENPETICLDTDIKSVHSFSSCKADGIDLDLFAVDGCIIYLNNVEKKCYNISYHGGYGINKRDQTLDEQRRSGQRIDYRTEDTILNAGNLTNAPFGFDALRPIGYACSFLSDESFWEISGEGEYLGRKAVEITGAFAPDSKSEYPRVQEMIDSLIEDYGVSSFRFTVDKLTGILLEFECWDENDRLIRETKVTELLLDQPEITLPKLEEELAYARESYHSKSFKSALKNPYFYPNPGALKKGEANQYIR